MYLSQESATRNLFHLFNYWHPLTQSSSRLTVSSLYVLIISCDVPSPNMIHSPHRAGLVPFDVLK